MESVLGGFLVRNHLHFGMKSIETIIGEKIRSIRRSRIPLITIEQLAEMSGLSRQTVGAIEKGKQPKVSYVTLARIAKALKMSLDELTGDVHLLIEQVAEQDKEYGSPKDTKKNTQFGGKSASERVPRHDRKRAG